MDAFEASKELQRITNQIYALIAEGEKLADEHDLWFELNVAYGMGGAYVGGEWQSSSENC